jgi:hypothetical protein
VLVNVFLLGGRQLELSFAPALSIAINKRQNYLFGAHSFNYIVAIVSFFNNCEADLERMMKCGRKRVDQ